jgi:hypothetical protein
MTAPMIESEWLASSDPEAMLAHLGCKAGERKRRLFACACCRRVWHLLLDQRVRHAVEIAERFADQQVSERDLEKANDGAEVVYRSNAAEAVNHSAAHAVIFLTAGHVDASYTAILAAQAIVDLGDIGASNECERANFNAERTAQSSLLRDIIGNPFHSVVIDHSWLGWEGGKVTKIAQAIYDNHTFDRMTLLADTLVKAACANEDILEHCGSVGEHVRGCWVVDLLNTME